MCRVFTWEFQSVHDLQLMISSYLRPFPHTKPNYVSSYFLKSHKISVPLITDMPHLSLQNYYRNLTFFKSDLITLTKSSFIWYMGKNYNSSETLQHYGFISFYGI